MLTVAGYDIVVERGGNNNVFNFGMRNFELPEIKLMIDAVSSSKYFGVEQSRELIEKLTKLESSHRSDKLRAYLNVDERIKMENETVFHIIDCICLALHYQSADSILILRLFSNSALSSILKMQVLKCC